MAGGLANFRRVCYPADMPTEVTLQLNAGEPDPGSAMAALMPQQRAFVELMTTLGSNPNAVTQAAAAAGYSANHGWKLMRDKRVLEAIREEANKRLLSGALLGASVLFEIAQTKGHKDQLKAAKELLAHNGFMPVAKQEITVNHNTPSEVKQMIAEIRGFAKQLGLDERKLLTSIGVADVIDAEFEAVAEPSPTVSEEWTE